MGSGLPISLIKLKSMCWSWCVTYSGITECCGCILSWTPVCRLLKCSAPNCPWMGGRLMCSNRWAKYYAASQNSADQLNNLHSLFSVLSDSVPGAAHQWSRSWGWWVVLSPEWWYARRNRGHARLQWYIFMAWNRAWWYSEPYREPSKRGFPFTTWKPILWCWWYLRPA